MLTPLTTGRLPTKRARRAFGFDETSVKRRMTEAKDVASMVEPVEEASGSLFLEQDEDEDVYDTEGYALGEAAENTRSPIRLVVDNVVSRRQRRAGIPLACSVDSFTAVQIGR